MITIWSRLLITSVSSGVWLVKSLMHLQQTASRRQQQLRSLVHLTQRSFQLWLRRRKRQSSSRRMRALVLEQLLRLWLSFVQSTQADSLQLVTLPVSMMVQQLSLLWAKKKQKNLVAIILQQVIMQKQNIVKNIKDGY
mgnify:CR=1 FL=1